jgi:hypothetical protein
MTLKNYSVLAFVALFGLALYLFPELRGWLAGLPLLLLYITVGLVAFAPIVIAKRRRHRNYWHIVIVTFVCWPVGLI